MKSSIRQLLLVSTPIGYLGSGKGGGVELTLSSLTRGLLLLGHKVVLIAPEGSVLPTGCSSAEIIHVEGMAQPSWQHQSTDSSVLIPCEGVLPRLWEKALELAGSADAVINFSYDWLPIWLTPRVGANLFHLISMGSVSTVMKELIEDISKTHHSRLAFHTYRQAFDYKLSDTPLVVGNGFDLTNYELRVEGGGPLGWAGRIAPEKGLEDAVSVAAAMGDKLFVWGIIEDLEYASKVESSAPAGTVQWRGFLSTENFQKELGACRAFLNTPKWNEAYGNVVVEAMACGVPVVAYDRGGPGELIDHGVTGWLVPPDDIEAMIFAALRIETIDRRKCRSSVEEVASQEGFASRVLHWVEKGMNTNTSSLKN